MDSLAKTGNYGSIHTIDTKARVYYVIKYVPGACTLQEGTTVYSQVSKARGLAGWSAYLS